MREVLSQHWFLMKLSEVCPGVYRDWEGGYIVQGPRLPSDTWSPVSLSTGLPAQLVLSVLTPCLLFPSALRCWARRSHSYCSFFSILCPHSCLGLHLIPPHPSQVWQHSLPVLDRLLPSHQLRGSGSFESGWVQLHRGEKEVNRRASAVGLGEWGGDRKSYELMMANPDVLFPHNSYSDKEVEIPSDLIQMTHLFFAKVKARIQLTEMSPKGCGCFLHAT